MIKSIRNIGCKAYDFVHKTKPRKVLSYVSICTLTPITSFYNGKVVAPAVMADIESAQKTLKEVVIKPVNRKFVEPILDPKTFQINWGDYIKNYNFQYQSLLRPKQFWGEKYTKILLKIMDEDKACKILDKEKLAKQIILVANEYEIDPIVMACIAKKESHFSQNVSNKAFKGMMQITKISIDDMYQKHREHLYMPYIKEIKERYKSSSELFKAIEDDSLLNIRVGALVYASKLKKTKGNLFESIKIYNNSHLKEQYAKSVYSDVQKYSGEII